MAGRPGSVARPRDCEQVGHFPFPPVDGSSPDQRQSRASEGEHVAAPAPSGAWRHFQFHDVEAALSWADAGNIAVHHTGFPFRRWKVTAHLWAKDETALVAAARQCGVQLRWIQRPPKSSRLHFDLFGTPLVRALALCGVKR